VKGPKNNKRVVPVYITKLNMK